GVVLPGFYGSSCRTTTCGGTSCVASGYANARRDQEDSFAIYRRILARCSVRTCAAGYAHRRRCLVVRCAAIAPVRDLLRHVAALELRQLRAGKRPAALLRISRARFHFCHSALRCTPWAVVAIAIWPGDARPGRSGQRLRDDV